MCRVTVDHSRTQIQLPVPRIWNELTINQSINQSNFYSANIPGQEPGSVARQPNRCSTAKSRKQLSKINWPWGEIVSMGGKAKSKRCVFRYFLKVATELTERTDSGRLFQKRQGTRVKSSSTSIGLDPRDWQTIIVVWSQWTGRNRCGKHGVKINELFFTWGFVG